MVCEIRDSEDKKKYQTFWENFGRFVKFGIIEEQAADNQSNKERLASLLQFPSSKSGDNSTSLDEYIGRLKENQKTIYYVSADNKEQAKSSPFVEKLENRDIEVLYLTEPVDEVMILNLTKYKDMEFTDVSREELKLDEDEQEKDKLEEKEKEYDDLLKFMKNSLGDQVEKVVVSQRLTDSPCILVTSKFGWSANMERIMKAQQMSDQKSSEYMKGKKILEINTDHELIQGLAQLVSSAKEENIQRANGVVEVVYQTALLTSGFQIDKPKIYSLQVYTLIAALMGELTKDVEEGEDDEEVEEVEAEEPASTPSTQKPTPSEVKTVIPEVVE
eukprot:TRINITY_DN1589_c0_g1_i1.p2 TRINITY_DN1589_c0_g1~~TRINITY_DN1589_c0_g1_i1.p2  ORF type:complete len:331 (+),score=72.74 TRINITY_DN1589_c0_g1_i1:3-995(+)